MPNRPHTKKKISFANNSTKRRYNRKAELNEWIPNNNEEYNSVPFTTAISEKNKMAEAVDEVAQVLVSRGVKSTDIDAFSGFATILKKKAYKTLPKRMEIHEAGTKEVSNTSEEFNRIRKLQIEKKRNSPGQILVSGNQARALGVEHATAQLIDRIIENDPMLLNIYNKLSKLSNKFILSEEEKLSIVENYKIFEKLLMKYPDVTVSGLTYWIELEEQKGIRLTLTNIRKQKMKDKKNNLFPIS